MDVGKIMFLELFLHPFTEDLMVYAVRLKLQLRNRCSVASHRCKVNLLWEIKGKNPFIKIKLNPEVKESSVLGASWCLSGSILDADEKPCVSLIPCHYYSLFY